MRAFVFLLLLANVALFAWAQGYLGKFDDNVAEPARLTAQVAPEKLRVVNQSEADKLVTAAKAAARRLCMEWGPFGTTDAERVQSIIEPFNLGGRLTIKRVEETAGFWVFLPPQGNKANADKKVDEIKKLGVTDYFVVTEEGANKYAISLGVFRSEDAANKYLADLTSKGIKTGKVGAKATQVQKSVFAMRELDTAAVNRLESLRPDFPAAELKTCGET
jgi:SPOR domain